MESNILFTIITWLCGGLFIGIGITALKMKTPIHFWSGTKVKKEEVTDVKAYNKANGIMWLTYGLMYILSGLAGIYGTATGAVLLVITNFPGLLIIVIVYAQIEKKYRIKKK